MVEPGKEKGKFRLRLSHPKWLTSLHLWVWYDLDKDHPTQLIFDRFERVDMLKAALKCSHGKITTTRFFVKEVPKEAKPFSLKLSVCGHCGSPTSNQFIVYSKGIENYPKVRDMAKYKMPGAKKPPKAEYMRTQEMGVA